MDKTTFAEQVSGMERTLYRVAISYLRQDADAADAVQDALIRAWEKRHTLRQPAYFGTWLTRILINRCKEMLRARRPQSPLHDELPAPQRDRAEDLALQMALEALDIKDRIPLLLYHLEGYPIRDIARILRLPQGTVKSRLARARQKLKHSLQIEEGEEVLGSAR